MTEGRYDLVVRGGVVYDGSGGPPINADVGVAGDRIVAVSAAGEIAGGALEIDAAGLAVAPGFVDVHSHDDAELLVDPLIPCKLLQGVTAQVVGNCGLGIAPRDEALREFAAWSPRVVDVPAWDGYGGYLDHLDQHPPALNVAVLVGHGTVRGAVMGRDERAPNTAELDAMQRLVEEGMDAGAVGLSTGLIYAPGRAADTDEIVALAEVAARAGGVYTSHIRNEADRLLDAVAEAIEVGERAGLPVEISHHKASGKANWGMVRRSLALVDDARQRGVRVTLDQYPYTAGSTHLRAVIENDALDGGKGGIGLVDPVDVVVASAPGHPEWDGLNLIEIGERLGMSPRAAADTVVDETGGTALAVLELMSEDDVRTVLSSPLTMIGSDGVVAPGKPHPRAWGTFVRVLGRYAREQGVLTMAEAVRRMTSLPSETFGLTDRGRIAVGYFGDLVVFDPETVTDVATYSDPRQPPVGIHAVVVNGEIAARHGEPTGRRPGRALRRV